MRAVGATTAAAVLLLAAATARAQTMQGFEGPFEGWGISEHNDLSHFATSTAGHCAQQCTVSTPAFSSPALRTSPLGAASCCGAPQ